MQYHHAVLRRSLNQAMRWGMPPRNVAALVAPPRVQRQEVRPLATQQPRRFLEAASGDRLEPLYAVALGLGLRHGEVLALTWDDIDLETGKITVHRTLQRYGGEHHLDEPKTERESASG